MISSLTWLDVSADQQRRVRELIRLFEEPGTRDELGIGPVRDAFSEMMFPGTAVIQTRARYLLFVPWHFQEAQQRGLRGEQLLQRVDRNERQLIERYRQAGFTDGLIGVQAGSRIKTLPSRIYWGGLERLGVLTSPMTPQAVSKLLTAQSGEDDELAFRRAGAWHPSMPKAPSYFPNEDSGGFELSHDEASWLQERIVDRASGTLLAELVSGTGLAESESPWEEPAVRQARSEAQLLVEHARRFSLIVHGAALLYNLLVSEAYEAEDFTTVQTPVDYYREVLADWAVEVREDPQSMEWDWPTFWQVVAEGNPRIPPAAHTFIEDWVEGVKTSGPEAVPDDDLLRRLVEIRVTKLRQGRSVLTNEKLLALWGGSSGASPLIYRWRTVRRIVLDIQEGLNRARS